MNEDSEDSDESARNELIERIEKYVNDVQSEYEIVDNNANTEKYDESLYKSVIVQYKRKRAVAQKYEDEKIETEEHQAKKAKASEYLLQIQKWQSGCNEAVQRKKDKYLGEYDEDEFASNMFVKLTKYFFNLYVVGATLEVFGDEIKKLTKKNAKKVTFGDLIGDDGVWKKLYYDLDFVIDELSEIYNQVWKDKKMQIICKRAKEFLSEYQGGDYIHFSKLICHYVAFTVIDEEMGVSLKHLEDDALGALVLMLADKRSFCLKLYKSMSQNLGIEEVSGDEEEKVEDKFEQIIAMIVVSICQIDALMANEADGVVSAEDQKVIDDKLQSVLGKCGQIGVDAKSQDVIRKFFGYFFKPENSGYCACDGDSGVSGFFGSLFGGMCSK